jgi:predicted transcriptional regulator
MRQATVRKQREKPRTANQKPLADGPMKNKKKHRFTSNDTEFIIKRRGELIAQGNNDRRIAKIIAPEMGLNFCSVIGKINYLLKKGVIKKNPNMAQARHFTAAEIQEIVQQREFLIKSDWNDNQIACKLAELINRTRQSVYCKINSLIQQGKIHKNPNKRKQANNCHMQETLRIRAELILNGHSDHEISKMVSEQTGETLRCVKSRISRLVEKGKVPPNLNNRKRENYSGSEIKTIISMRKMLVSKGLKDKEIIRKIAEKLRKSEGGIRGKITALVREGILQENPNKRVTQCFNEKDIKTVIKIWEEFLPKGFSDREQSRIISKKLDRLFRSVLSKVQRLSKLGFLSDNPNKKMFFSSEDIGYLIRRRAELEEAGCTDYQIAKKIAEEKQWKLFSITQKIRQLVKEGKIQKNVHTKKKKKFTAKDERDIIERRNKLEEEGKSDGQIIRIIAEKMQRSRGTINGKIRQLLEKGKLKENKNKKRKKPYGFFRKMSNEELIQYALNFLKSNEIIGKHRLEKTNRGLYNALSKRKLLNLVFKKLEHLGLHAGLSQAADAMEQFGGPG